MLAQAAQTGQLLEALMLLCFGVSWPIDVIKLVRTRRTEGKSLAFMVLVLIGYIAGIAGKFARVGGEQTWPEAVTLLYLFNVVAIGFDIGLYLLFSRQRAEARSSVRPD